MTREQELRFRWRPEVSKGAGGVEVALVDPAVSGTDRVKVVSVVDARRWAAFWAAETGDRKVVDDLERLLARHGVDELHPEWTVGEGFALRGGRSATRRPVRLKDIVALIFYLRLVGEVDEAARLRAELQNECVRARAGRGGGQGGSAGKCGGAVLHRRGG